MWQYSSNSVWVTRICIKTPQRNCTSLFKHVPISTPSLTLSHNTNKLSSLFRQTQATSLITFLYLLFRPQISSFFRQSQSYLFPVCTKNKPFVPHIIPTSFILLRPIVPPSSRQCPLLQPRVSLQLMDLPRPCHSSVTRLHPLSWSKARPPICFFTVKGLSVSSIHPSISAPIFSILPYIIPRTLNKTVLSSILLTHHEALNLVCEPEEKHTNDCFFLFLLPYGQVICVSFFWFVRLISEVRQVGHEERQTLLCFSFTHYSHTHTLTCTHSPFPHYSSEISHQPHRPFTLPLPSDS